MPRTFFRLLYAGFLQNLDDVVHRGRGFQALNNEYPDTRYSRVGWYSSPKPASLKVLLVTVTRIDKESLYTREPGYFRKGVQLYSLDLRN